VEQAREIAIPCRSGSESVTMTGVSQEETLEPNLCISEQGIESEQESLLPVMITADEFDKDMPTTAKEISQTILPSDTCPIGELCLTVGPEGGHNNRGDLSLFVPAGAVNETVTLTAKLYISKRKFPYVDIAQGQYIFSPVLSLEPQGYQFKQTVLVRCPFSAVPGGWRLFLLRSDCQLQAGSSWKQIVVYDTDTGEVTTDDCQFDVDRALLGVTHFCDHCWYGIARVVTPFKSRKMLYCSAFGCQPDPAWNRWHLELHLHDYCRDIFEVF
jgi:hypothetical protein